MKYTTVVSDEEDGKGKGKALHHRSEGSVLTRWGRGGGAVGVRVACRAPT